MPKYGLAAAPELFELVFSSSLLAIEALLVLEIVEIGKFVNISYQNSASLNVKQIVFPLSSKLPEKFYKTLFLITLINFL